MAILNFPTNPSIGDQYNENGVTYTWNGAAWTANGAENTDSRYVQTTGDTMTGNLTVPSLNGGQLGGNRNLIINGAMAVAQRGTGDTGVTTGPSYAADRFRLNISSCGTWATSNTTSNLPSGFSNSIKLDCTSQKPTLTSTNNLFFSQYIEAKNLQHLAYGTSDAKKITLSFWVKSNLTGEYVVELDHGDGVNFNGIKYTIDAANTWEYKTLTFDGDTSSVINNDNGVGLYVQWCLAAGPDLQSGTFQSNTWHSTTGNRFVGQVNLAASNTNEWQITGVQLEVGSTATPFEHRPYATELALCQRYFYRWIATSNYARFASGIVVTNSQVRAIFTLPVPMRVSPTSMNAIGPLLHWDGSTSNSLNSLVIEQNHPYRISVNSGSALQGLIVGRAAMIGANNDPSTYIEFSAEL